MISYKEALALIAAEAKPQPDRLVDRNESLGLIVANDIHSTIDVPSFNNSAMDGFALHASKTAGISADKPRRFSVRHCLAAGDVLDTADQSLAVEIMTGAKIPNGFDAVVPVERTTAIKNANGETIEVEMTSPLQKGDNIRYA